MPRAKGSGKFGPVRSLRLPLELDRWFESRLREDALRPASDMLLEAVHGGLRLQPGYMRRQYSSLAALVSGNDLRRYETYVRALNDTFGSGYVKHLEAWLRSEGVLPLEAAGVERHRSDPAGCEEADDREAEPGDLCAAATDTR
jgi:hypothetical protein